MKKTLIERIEVGSGGAASIEFTSIPADYTDLVIYTSTRDTGDSTAAVLRMQFNSTTSNYTTRWLQGSGSSASSSTYTTDIRVRTCASDNTADTFGSALLYIPNYLSSAYKSVSADGVQETNATAGYQTISAGLWSDTSAITSIKLFMNVGNVAQYSSASLYGVTAGNDGTTTVS